LGQMSIDVVPLPGIDLSDEVRERISRAVKRN
jgi:hypothetical protein